MSDSCILNDINKAKKLLLKENYSCVLVKGESVFTSIGRGISPVMSFIDEGIDLKGYSLADKIIGKAMAMVVVYSGIIQVHASLISQEGLKYLNDHKIGVSYDEICEKIINRTNTGICPMEMTVSTIDDPKEGYEALKEKVRMMKEKNNDKAN